MTEELRGLYLEALRDAYLRLRRRWVPEMHTVSHSHDPKFLRLAQLLFNNDLDPYRYMKFAFEFFARFSADVFPNQVCAPKVVSNYMYVKDEMDRDIRVMVQLQRSKIEGRLRAGDSIDEILLDPYEHLSAVFRYAVASAMGRDDLAIRFKAKALEMIVFEPLYKEVLQDLLPQETTHA